MVLVRAHKFAGSNYRSWAARLLAQEGPLIILEATFAEKVHHDLLGIIAEGTVSREYYWLDRWYNVFRFSGPGGELRNYYCNVNFPPEFDGQVLSYVDLDIDLLVNADYSYSVLDEDEFELNATTYGYSDQLRHNVRTAVDQLKELIESRSFPFLAAPTLRDQYFQ
jgi:protein associated with RNAse G/E